MVSADRTLLRLHVEAVWGVQLPSLVQNDVELLREGLQPPWKLCAAQLTHERVHIWKPDVPASERETLLQRVDNIVNFSSPFPSIAGIEREVALSFTASPRFDSSTAEGTARPLTSKDRFLIENFEPNSLDYYYHQERQPLIGTVIEGHLLSLAHSSRRTREACELGIETLPGARRKGYALAATILWTWAIQQEGLVPIYSANISNIASLRVAAAAGYQPFAHIALLAE